jgi:hypothetical protein
MNKGKSTCKVLKDIRQKIADANGIRYVPKECNFKGEYVRELVLRAKQRYVI